jgi:hypothetical protein
VKRDELFRIAAAGNAKPGRLVLGSDGLAVIVIVNTARSFR